MRVGFLIITDQRQKYQPLGQYQLLGLLPYNLFCDCAVYLFSVPPRSFRRARVTPLDAPAPPPLLFCRTRALTIVILFCYCDTDKTINKFKTVFLFVTGDVTCVYY